jgi:hypothetical protein
MEYFIRPNFNRVILNRANRNEESFDDKDFTDASFFRRTHKLLII